METGSDNVRCPRCGAENPARSKFCARCYGLLRGPRCPHCGRQATRAGARFCEHCGGDLQAPPSLWPPVRQDPADEVPAPPSQAAPAEPPGASPEADTGDAVLPVAAAPEPPRAEAPVPSPAAAPAPSAEHPVLPVPSVPVSPTSPVRPPEAGAKPQTAAPPAPPAKPAVRPGQRPVAKRPAPPPPRPRFGLLTVVAGLTVVVAMAVILGSMLRRPDLSGVIPAVTTPAPQATPSPRPPSPTAGHESPATSASTGGTLQIATRPPGAQVELDGIAVGVTPVTLTGVTPGRHTIKVSRPGFKPDSRDVEVIRGETLTLDLVLSAPASPGTPRRRAPGAPLPPPPLPPPPP